MYCHLHTELWINQNIYFLPLYIMLRGQWQCWPVPYGGLTWGEVAGIINFNNSCCAISRTCQNTCVNGSSCKLTSSYETKHEFFWNIQLPMRLLSDITQLILSNDTPKKSYIAHEFPILYISKFSIWFLSYFFHPPCYLLTTVTHDTHV